MRKFSKHIFKNLFVFAVLMLCGGFLFAQESLDTVYAQIDLAIVEHSSDKVAVVLTKYLESKNYDFYESYTLKKARQLIIEDDLIFARDTTLVVIDHNLENFDAVELYSYIDRAILDEQANRQAEENRLRLEAERVAALNEKAKLRIAKSDNYSNVSTASGQSVYINHEKYFSSIDWNINVGIADVLFQKVTSPKDYQSLKYGLSFGANLFYKTEEYILGGEIFADMAMLTVGMGEQEVITSAKFIPMFALPAFSKKTFFRVGFAAQGVGGKTEDEVETGSVGTFLTPAFGIGFLNLNVGNSLADIYYDYYLGHLAYDDIASSMEMGASILFPMTGNERTTIGFKFGVVDTLFLKDEGIDNRAKFILAIGVGNVKN